MEMDWLDLAEKIAPAPFYWAISVAQTFHITVYDLRIFVLLICLTLIVAVNYWLPTGVYLISNTCITFFISIAWLWTICSNFFVQILRHLRLNDCWNFLWELWWFFELRSFHDLLIYWIIWRIPLEFFFNFIFSSSLNPIRVLQIWDRWAWSVYFQTYPRFLWFYFQNIYLWNEN